MPDALPPGKTCQNCFSCQLCDAVIKDFDPDSTVCRFDPSHFAKDDAEEKEDDE